MRYDADGTGQESYVAQNSLRMVEPRSLAQSVGARKSPGAVATAVASDHAKATAGP